MRRESQGASLKIPLGKLATERIVPLNDTVALIDRIVEYRSRVVLFATRKTDAWSSSSSREPPGSSRSCLANSQGIATAIEQYITASASPYFELREHE